MIQTTKYIKDELKERFENRELNSIIKRIYEHVLHITHNQTHTLNQYETNINNIQIETITSIVNELKKGKPLQYVLGYADFYDLRFYVNQHTLIPRQETEELVHLILKNHNSTSINVLDLGTGSGCIPISLKKNRPLWNVQSVDISEEALQVAQKNALDNQTDVLFTRGNILNWQTIEHLNVYDVMVSNPPYVLESEKALMHNQVLNYEPHLALFVENNEALIFYLHILELAISHLKVGGKLYFEINETKAQELMAICVEKGFKNVETVLDLNGKDRFVTMTK